MKVNFNLSNTKRGLHDVVVALSEVIISQQEDGMQHDPTPTEFFAILLATISSNVETDHLVELLIILDAVIPQSSIMVVKSQFKLLFSSLVKIAKFQYRLLISKSVIHQKY
jgi:hypothetical protein